MRSMDHDYEDHKSSDTDETDGFETTRLDYNDPSPSPSAIIEELVMFRFYKYYIYITLLPEILK